MVWLSPLHYLSPSLIKFPAGALLTATSRLAQLQVFLVHFLRSSTSLPPNPVSVSFGLFLLVFMGRLMLGQHDPFCRLSWPGPGVCRSWRVVGSGWRVMTATQTRSIQTSVLLTQSASGVLPTGFVRLFMPQPTGPPRKLYKSWTIL